MQIRRTSTYDKWISNLRDFAARSKIAARISRLEEGNPGDSRSVGSGVFELRINFGPGYRVYYIRQADVFILLLCGGDKSTQARDIELAKQLARDFD